MPSRQDDRYTEARQRLFGIVAVGIFLAIGVGVLGFAEKRSEFVVVKACFAGISLCLLACYWLWLIGRHRSRKRKLTWGLVAVAGAASVVGISFPWIEGKEREREPPDITLCFVDRQHPVIWVLNLSDSSVENAVFASPALFDIDGPTPDDPLQITGQTYNLISPNAMSGGNDIFSNMHGSPILKNGDHIVGSVGIKCPKCEVGHSFYVSIVWGSGGWFSRIKNANSGDILLLMNTADPSAPHTSSAAYVRNIDAVPNEDRIPIRNISELADVNHNVVASNCTKR